MLRDLTRRGFLSFLGASAVPTAVEAVAAAPPLKAWIILAQQWQYNDEYTYPEGDPAPHGTKIYYDKAEADRVCAELCAAFFESENPEEYAGEWYFDDRAPDQLNWPTLRELGFPDPYCVQELSHE